MTTKSSRQTDCSVFSALGLAKSGWVAGLCGFALSATAGCGELINPYWDNLPATAMITTASASRIVESGTPGAMRSRGWSGMIVQSQDQGVSHWPLWFEDWPEDSGSDDGEYKWTWLDYFCIAYSPARMALNIAGLPVSVLVDLPGSVRCSDGRISRQTFGLRNHDAVRCGGVAIPPDMIEAYP